MATASMPMVTIAATITQGTTLNIRRTIRISLGRRRQRKIQPVLQHLLIQPKLQIPQLPRQPRLTQRQTRRPQMLKLIPRQTLSQLIPKPQIPKPLTPKPLILKRLTPRKPTPSKLTQRPLTPRLTLPQLLARIQARTQARILPPKTPKNRKKPRLWKRR